jgi:SPP1 family phage portal protein
MQSGYITLQQLINANIIIGQLQLQSKMIKDIIDTDKSSLLKQKMREGQSYFEAKHDVLNHRNFYYLAGNKLEDKTKANNKLVHPFHKILVEQKSSYAVGNPIKVTYDEAMADSESKALNKSLMTLMGDSFDDIINDWVVGASNKSEEWIHCYIDDKGLFNYIIVDARELIPIYDSQYQKNLVGMIRYYSVEQNKGAEKKYITKVEWWTSTNVTYYTETDAGDYVLDVEAETEFNPSAHWYTSNTQNPDAKKSGSWGKVPFIRLKNNSQGKTDLEAVKILIDAYDKVKSGWVNDLDDFQELILVLKGYAGIVTNDQRASGYSELDVFFQNLKTKKVIPVDEDGGVEPLKAEIPITAREKFLEITRREIFYFGQGIDIDNDKFGNSPSGVSLKFLYSSLDMKVNTLFRKLTFALSDLMFFFVGWINLTEKKSYDYKLITFLYNKSIIFNEKEKIDGLVASVGMISEETIIANHPLVTDPAEEMLKLEAEKEKEVDAYKLSLNKVQPPVVDPDKKKEQSK